MSVQLQDIPSTDRLFTCDGCRRSERRKVLPEGDRAEIASARFVGWRFPDVASPTVAYCPACAGSDDDYWSNVPQESWRVRCDTCDWEWEDDFDEGPLDAKQAKRLADGHECEPDVLVMSPAGDRWLRTRQVNDDGAVKS